MFYRTLNGTRALACLPKPITCVGEIFVIYPKYYIFTLPEFSPRKLPNFMPKVELYTQPYAEGRRSFKSFGEHNIN